MRKVSAVLLALALALLCGCAPKLAEGFDNDALIEAGNAVIDIVNAREYQKLIDMGRSDFNEQVSAEFFEENVSPVLDSLGEFKSVESAMAIGAEANGEDMATVLLVCSYEKQKVTYSVTFDIDMLLAGIFIQ